MARSTSIEDVKQAYVQMQALLIDECEKNKEFAEWWQRTIKVGTDAR